MTHELPFTFECGEDRLCGILHQPSEPHNTGMIVVVGGPQYRVGSHRQFVFLARSLSDQGIPVLRFDYRGMGDSEGEQRTFEQIDDDIRSAVDAFETKTGLKRFVLWGLCDGATAASYYAHKDARVIGLVLVNPWIRSEAGLAKAYLKHYYFSRLLDREFWVSIRNGKFDWGEAVRGLLDNIRRSNRNRENNRLENVQSGHLTQDSTVDLDRKMRESLEKYSGKVFILLSGSDMTAAEFEAATRRSRKWRKLLGNRHYQSACLPEADHTFSATESRTEAEKLTLAWLRKL